MNKKDSDYFYRLLLTHLEEKDKDIEIIECIDKFFVKNEKCTFTNTYIDIFCDNHDIGNSIYINFDFKEELDFEALDSYEKYKIEDGVLFFLVTNKSIMDKIII